MPLMNQHSSPSHKRAGADARDSVNAHSIEVLACRDVRFSLARLLIPRSIKVPLLRSYLSNEHALVAHHNSSVDP